MVDVTASKVVEHTLEEWQAMPQEQFDEYIKVGRNSVESGRQAIRDVLNATQLKYLGDIQQRCISTVQMFPAPPGGEWINLPYLLALNAATEEICDRLTAMRAMPAGTPPAEPPTEPVPTAETAPAPEAESAPAPEAAPEASTAG